MRIDQTKAAKDILENKPEYRRAFEKPILRSLEVVENDERGLKIKELEPDGK